MLMALGKRLVSVLGNVVPSLRERREMAADYRNTELKLNVYCSTLTVVRVFQEINNEKCY
jgi:hypothetical protein